MLVCVCLRSVYMGVCQCVYARRVFLCMCVRELCIREFKRRVSGECVSLCVEGVCGLYV